MSNTLGSTIATFTCNSAQEIKDHGGDYDWVLNPRRAKNCQFLLCVSFRGHKDYVIFVRVRCYVFLLKHHQ